MPFDVDTPHWTPLCALSALDDAALYRAEFAGTELVVWRATDDTVNVWEDRCPHRGVRLSLGHHRGEVLQCQYHGWQFDGRDHCDAAQRGRCAFVPAHREAAAPPVRVSTWPVAVHYGIVWTCAPIEQGQTLPAFEPVAELEAFGSRSVVWLRSLPIEASVEEVERALADYQFDHDGFDVAHDPDCVAFELAPQVMMVECIDGDAVAGAQSVVFLLHAPHAEKTWLHGVVTGAPQGAAPLIVQRHHQLRLNALRDHVERQAVARRRDVLASSVQRADASVSATGKSNAGAGVGASVDASAPMPRSADDVLVDPSMLTAAVQGQARNAAGDGCADLTGQCATVRSHTGDSNDRTDRVDALTDRAFTVHLARSGKSVHVDANVSLLDALRAHKVDVPTSCEQGVCGTCLTRVLDGTPQHRDMYLTTQERAAGDAMLICVSRALSATMTLDL